MEEEKDLTRLYVLVAVIVTIVVLVVIIFIWFPKSGDSKDIYRYTVADDYKEQGYNAIYSSVRSLLYTSNVDSLYKKMDTSFLSEKGLNEQNFKNYMIANNLIGDSVTLKNYSVLEEGDTVIYRLNYVVSGNFGQKSNVVNIIETYPYEYTLSFEQDSIPITSSNDKTIEDEGIRFEVKITERKNNQIKYNVKITNLYNTSVKFDFTNANNVYLKLSDGSVIKQTSIITSDDNNVNLEKDSYITKEFVFNISLENQSNIKSLVFTSINVDENSKDVIISF